MQMSVAYITGRQEPHIDWFFDSLSRQIQKDDHLQIIIVDRFADNEKRKSFIEGQFVDALIHSGQEDNINSLIHIEPKPNVWQGKHRLTSQDWWAMSNARNSALCYAKNEYVCFCDDLSVLLPGWLDAVKEAMAGNYIACGAYRKVKKLEVENGEVKSWEPHIIEVEENGIKKKKDAGLDTRFDLAPDIVGPCTGDWLYGCSCGFPTEALLTVGGWPEYCDGLGSEDYCLGIALGNAGFHLKYDKRMMTYESEELHNYTVGSDTTWDDGVRVSGGLKRMDKGISPNDKSHAALNIAKGSKYFPNYYNGGIRSLRDFVLAGNQFPIIQQPQHDWFDGQRIDEM